MRLTVTHRYDAHSHLHYEYEAHPQLCNEGEAHYYTIGVRHTHIHISVTIMRLTHIYITSASTQSYVMSYHCEAHSQLCYGCGPTHI